LLGGAEDGASSMTLNAAEVNPSVDPALFEKPKP